MWVSAFTIHVSVYISPTPSSKFRSQFVAESEEFRSTDLNFLIYFLSQSFVGVCPQNKLKTRSVHMVIEADALAIGKGGPD